MVSSLLRYLIDKALKNLGDGARTLPSFLLEHEKTYS